MNERQHDVLCNVSAQGVATLTLNRVEKHNAFDGVMIAHLLVELERLSADPSVRVLVLQANGQHFSAGADLLWMRSMAGQSKEHNYQDASELARLMQTLDSFPHPTIALVHGSAFGGALGLICCCDIAIATQDARFCLSEVKLGLIPATIGPYVCRAIGQRQARRYMLSAETLDAANALRLGLLHQVVGSQPYALREVLDELLHRLLHNGPNALIQAKRLCQQCDNQPITPELIEHTIALIAQIRVSPEGQEGLNAFFSKRAPAWVPKDWSAKDTP
ncbi:enoyl-CoA hydratase-related protein [Vibrio navarrensis]|uniref:enoyl-CoA hydratase-related protein n=1 Tax=Vibrio navarrensis TaxID=29495 RepID=UPI001302B6E4|nr:enoyl-CoA hydratase-related protein [Vibrio navarrensis]EJL6398147.1 enoyl-CoA hydratase/isomerase family protein [Vibrio navarrensis]EJL6566507.1 enoyl-CoA hydratase/isomerase family protein [Vibrio navarrensis]